MPKFIVLIGLILCLSAQAQFLVRGDDDYWTENHSRIQYIFTDSHTGTIPELQFYMNYFTGKYEKSFYWQLDETLRLVVASSRNQVANGFATPSPLLQTVHFPTGSELLDRFASDSFMLSLASHETAHLYQLTPKSQLGSWAKSVVGNTPFLITPIVPIPIFVFPNAFLPRFMLEGNAVLNESTIERGGRLWSGEVRAEVLAAVAADKVRPDLLLNSRLDFPLQEPYHQGGYFMAFLAERYGVERVNRFYMTHRNRDFYPFNMNKSFREHFGQSYTRLIHDYLQWVRPFATKHRPAEGPLLAHTFNRPTFNHDNEIVRFVGNRDGHNSNELFEISKSAATVARKARALPDGKVFQLDGRDWGVSSELVSPTLISYGLFADSLEPRTGSLGLIYQDVRAGHSLAIDAAASYARNVLLKDDRFFDVTASSAILDDQGRAYYFRQAGDERILYRDQQPLFKYRGYYGIPAEVTAEGVHFIASSPWGSSLFRWNGSTIERLTPFDNIVDARKLRDKQFVVAAVTDQGYDIRLVDTEAKAEGPAWFDWKFETRKLPAPPDKPETTTNSIRETYSPYSEMRFAMAEVMAGAGGGRLSAFFTDPMQWSTFGLSLEQTEGPDQAVSVAYTNNRHRLGWFVSGGYAKNTIKSLVQSSKVREEGVAKIGLDYFLLRWRRWTSHFLIGPRFASDSLQPTGKRQTYGGEAAWMTSYVRMDSPLQYQPETWASLSLRHRTDVQSETGQKADNINSGEIALSADVFHETYLGFSGSWAKAERNSIKVNYLKAPRESQFSIPTLLSEGEADEVREWQVSLMQAINWSYYFTRFPLSVRRLAPYVSLRDIWTHEVRADRLPGWRQQLQYGTEIEMLLFNLFPTRARLAFDTINVGRETQNGFEASLIFTKDY